MPCQSSLGSERMALPENLTNPAWSIVRNPTCVFCHCQLSDRHDAFRADHRSIGFGPVCSPHKSASRCVAVSRAPPHDTGPAGSTGFSSSLALAPSRIKFPLASPAFIDRTMPDVCSGARPAGTISIRHKGAASLQAVSSRRPAWLKDRTWRAVSMLSPRTIPAAGLSTYGRVRPPETLAISFFPRRLRRLPRAASLTKKLPARILRCRCGPVGFRRS